jgi:hypothetical protein
MRSAFALGLLISLCAARQRRYGASLPLTLRQRSKSATAAGARDNLSAGAIPHAAVDRLNSSLGQSSPPVHVRGVSFAWGT